MIKNNLKIIAFSFLLSSAYIVQAEIYQCKDKYGVINFTSIPCGEKLTGIKRQEKKIELNEDGTKKTREELRSEKQNREQKFLETAKRERVDKKKKHEKLERHKAKVKQNCERAKRDLIDYQRASVIYHKKKDANGKKRSLSDAEREKAIYSAQRRISYWCRK